MNTFLNLLSAVAVVVTGAFALIVAPAPRAPQAQVQPLPMAPSLVSTTESQGPWLTLSGHSRAGDSELQAVPGPRWIF